MIIRAINTSNKVTCDNLNWTDDTYVVDVQDPEPELKGGCSNEEYVFEEPKLKVGAGAYSQMEAKIEARAT